MSELDALAADLAKAGARIGAKAATVVRKSAAAIEATSKQFAPVDTGLLRNSIGIDLTGDGRTGTMEAAIGPTVDYAAFVEFGTSRQGPAAFMGPALDRHSPDFVEAMEQLGGEVL